MSLQPLPRKRVYTSVTQVAEQVLGDVRQWRKVLADNPQSLPFSLPPSVQREIDGLNNTIAFTGLKIPSANQIETELKRKLGELANPVLAQVEGEVSSVVSSALKELEQIDWLL